MNQFAKRFLAYALLTIWSGLSAGATTFVVMNLNDSGAGSLRQALADARGAAGADSITFAPNLAGQTIALTNGQLVVDSDVTIDGSALTNGITISGRTNSRVFQIDINMTVTMNWIHIAGGKTPDGTNNLSVDPGGGVANSGTLTLNNSVISRNATGNGLTDVMGTGGGNGGGFYNTGILTLKNCTVSGNTTGAGGSATQTAGSGGLGGGFCNTGTLALNNCTVSGNTTGAGGTGDTNGIYGGDGGAGGAGAAFYNTGTLTLNNSTVSGNITGVGGNGAVGGEGGGFYNRGSLTLNNSTISGNVASHSGPSKMLFLGGHGGGVFTIGPMAITNSTIVNNQTLAFGGGMFVNFSGTNSPSVILNNSILAGNIAYSGTNYRGSNPAYVPNFQGPNLVDLDPQLAPLGNYGGPTQTMPPLPGSPAINAGGPATFGTDQRGLPRISGSAQDIGAVEIQFQTVTTTNESGTGSLREAIGNADAVGTIIFATNLSGRTIKLTNGQLTLDKSLNIDASALLNGLTISGNTNSRVFQINQNAFVTMNSLRITGGRSPDGTNASTSDFGGNGFKGGGILNSGTLKLNNSIIFGNLTGNGGFGRIGGDGGQGGGVHNSGTLTLSNSTVSGNTTGIGGNGTVGGGNGGSGGGLYDSGTLSLNNCTVSGNVTGNSGSAGTPGSGGLGGGFYVSGILTLNNCTLSGNSTGTGGEGGAGMGGSGGGIWIGGDGAYATINNSTIAKNNVAPNAIGGGILIANSTPTITLNNTILAGNTSPGASEYDGTAPIFQGTNLVGLDPRLAPLGNYGGLTQTMPPLVGSPAIDAGSDSVTNFLSTDQRGFARKFGAHVDIGAYELIVAGSSILLESPVKLGNGGFRFGFTNTPGAYFTVLASTNLAFPNSWIVLTGGANESPAGQFQFTDPAATNSAQRFYRVRSP